MAFRCLVWRTWAIVVIKWILSLSEKKILKKAMIANNLILPSEFHQLIEVIDKALYITLVMSCENKLIIIILCQITIKIQFSCSRTFYEYWSYIFLLINLFAVLRSHRGQCHEGTPVLAVVEILFKISMIGVSLLRSISYVGHKSSCVYIYYVPQTL